MTVPIPSRHLLTRVGVPFAVVAATASVLAWASWSTLVPAPTVDAYPVVARVTNTDDGSAPQPTSVSVQAAGWVEPDPFPIAVPALTEGVVTDVLVLEGGRVARDEIVARLVRDDAALALAAARAEVDRRAALQDVAAATLRQAQDRIDALIDRTRERSVAEARLRGAQASADALDAEVASATSELTLAVDAAARVEAAIAGGGVSEIDRVRSRERVVAARAALDALAAKRQMLEAAVAEADAGVTAARRALDLLIDERAALAMAAAEAHAARAELDLARSRLAEAELRLARTEVRSPADGVVLERIAVPGTRVGGEGSMPVVHLYDPSSLQVRADVANADIALVGVGMTAEITIETLPDHTLRGTVTRIVGLADIQKNTVQVKIAIEDPPPELRPDMLCRVRIGGGAAAGTAARDGRASRLRILAPRRLVDVGAESVAVVGPLDRSVGTVERRGVALGAADGDWIEIVSGVRPGDLLVDPTFRAGSTVRVRTGGSDAQ